MGCEPSLQDVLLSTNPELFLTAACAPGTPSEEPSPLERLLPQQGFSSAQEAASATIAAAAATSVAATSPTAIDQSQHARGCEAPERSTVSGTASDTQAGDAARRPGNDVRVRGLFPKAEDHHFKSDVPVSGSLGYALASFLGLGLETDEVSEEESVMSHQ